MFSFDQIPFYLFYYLSISFSLSHTYTHLLLCMHIGLHIFPRNTFLLKTVLRQRLDPFLVQTGSETVGGRVRQLWKLLSLEFQRMQ